MPIGAGVGALVGGALSAGGTVAGGLIQSGNAGRASGQAQRNLELVLPQMQQSYNQTVGGYQALQPQIQQRYNELIGGYQPYAASGAASTADMQDLLGLNGPDAANAAMAKFQASPGYQWELGQGLRAVDAGAAAQGMLRSGATLKAEQTYGQGLADQEFGNYYNRLSGLAGQGLTGLGGAGNATANMFGNLLTAQGGIAGANQNLIAQETGNATGQNAAIIGGANAQNSILGNTTSSLGNTVNTLFNNPQVLNTLSGWFGGGGGGSTFTPSPTGTYGGQTSFTGPTTTYAPATYNF